MTLKEISFIEFDEFSKKYESSTFYQSSSYALIMGEKGYDYEYIGMFDDMNNLIAASLILLKKIKKNILYGYAPRGFLIDYLNESEVKCFSNLLIDYYKNKNVAFIKVNPNLVIKELSKSKKDYSDNKNASFILDRNNFLRLKNNLYFESSLPHFNAIVDLDNFGYASMKKNARNKVNKAIRKGLILEKADREDIPLIEKMMKKNKSFCDISLDDYYNVFDKSNSIDMFLVKIDYEEFLINARISYDKETEKNTYYNAKIVENPTEDIINAKMNSDLVLLSYKNDILEGTKGLKEEKEDFIAAAVVVKYKDTITIVESTYDKAYSRHNANYFLYYKIMEYYKNDYKYCDLNGMTGDTLKSNPYYGLNKFKLSFNPKFVEYIGELDFIVDPEKYSYLKETNALAKEFNKN